MNAKCLPFGFEARDDFLGIHPGFNDLERNLPLHRLSLLGDIDDAHAALTDFFSDVVGANVRTQYRSVDLNSRC